MKALRSAVLSCKNYKVRINAALALGVPQQRSSLGSTSALTSVIEDLLEGVANAPSCVELTDFKYNDALNVQVALKHTHKRACL